MSIPAGVTKVVFGGALPGGENWESGFWIEGSVPSSNSVANALASLILGDLTSSSASGVWHNMAAYIANSVYLSYCRVYCYPTGGPAATYIGEATITAVPGGATSILPNQVCYVMSLRTDSAGRRNRGRMYIPFTGTAISLTTGQTSGANVTAWASAWATFFSDWNASGDNGTISVVSRVGAGSAVPVTAVYVDTIPDTQRRRRNKMVATSVAVANVT